MDQGCARHRRCLSTSAVARGRCAPSVPPWVSCRSRGSSPQTSHIFHICRMRGEPLHTSLANFLRDISSLCSARILASSIRRQAAIMSFSAIPKPCWCPQLHKSKRPTFLMPAHVLIILGLPFLKIPVQVFAISPFEHSLRIFAKRCPVLLLRWCPRTQRGCNSGREHIHPHG